MRERSVDGISLGGTESGIIHRRASYPATAVNQQTGLSSRRSRPSPLIQILGRKAGNIPHYNPSVGLVV